MKRSVFITGSTRGIGKAIAIEFAKKKHTVILHGNKKTSQSDEMFKSFRKKFPDSHICYFNIGNYRQCSIECSKILKKFKIIDILVNNAGIVNNVLFTKMTYQDFDHVINTNLYGTFNVTKSILPPMIKNKWGRVINLSSVSALIGDFGQTNYSASKAAIIGFTKSLAKETARFNITVNAVCPGLVNTDILKNVPKEYMKSLIDKIPLKRMAEPYEIAQLVIFLASDNSCYITGEYININGGLL